MVVRGREHNQIQDGVEIGICGAVVEFGLPAAAVKFGLTLKIPEKLL